MADIIANAQAKRQQLLAEVARIDTFLALAAEFSEGEAPITTPALTAHIPTPPPRVRERQAPKTGVVKQTAEIIRDHMRAYGEGLKTRELVPVVENAGVVINGVNKVATLSARIFTSQMFERRGSGWFIRHKADEETADISGKDGSAASLFNANKGEQHDAAALVS